MSETEDDIIAKVSDYLDGEDADRAEISKKIADDPEWKRIHDEMVETRKALSGLQKALAPSTFAADVTSTIHKRSGGRFFGRRSVGDKIPFGALLVIALLVVGIVGYLMWSSDTGSLKVDHGGGGGGSGSSERIVPKL